MLYLGIDQHKSQLTVNLRAEHGNVIDKRQVNTKHSDIDDYFGKLAKQAAKRRGFMAVVEVCGFNHWLLEELQRRCCREIVVVQPDDSAVNKTDQRDANTLCELLWNNRKHFQNGNRPNGIRRIYPAEPADQEIRQLANHRQSLVRQRVRIINQLKSILNKHNIMQDAPSENFRSKKFKDWIATALLPTVDRITLDSLIGIWKTFDEQILNIESELVKRAENNPNVFRLISIPGVTAKGAILLLSRIGDIKRFKNPDSLANYFGLTPGCHNTGKSAHVGGITKRGSTLARVVLNAAVNHVVRKDPSMKEWHKKIKKRRGAKIARVAVMRRLATIVWHILRWDKKYQFRYEPPKPDNAENKQKNKTVFKTAKVPKPIVCQKGTATHQGGQRPPGEVFQGIGKDNHSRKKKTSSPSRSRAKT